MKTGGSAHASNPEKTEVTRRIACEISERLKVLRKLGLGYLSRERSTPTLPPGELQRLRLAMQLHSNQFGVVYVLDEPSARLHPADTEALLDALDALKRGGNSLFLVEHERCGPSGGLDRRCWTGGGRQGWRDFVLGAAEGVAQGRAVGDAAIFVRDWTWGACGAARACGLGD